MFISRSSLWTDLDCVDENKTRVYLERSKSLPVNLSLHTKSRLLLHHPFSKIIPHAIGRLGSLSIQAVPEDIENIAAHLSCPAPLLEKLSIRGGYRYEPHLNPVLTPAIFNGDLSSLRVLKLESVRTEFPWRNMANLTSLKLLYTSSGGVTVRQLLDFFESAPHLRKVHLYHATPTPGAQNGRLVLLPCLERMAVTGRDSASLLLDHLLIPVGAHLKIGVDLPSPPDQGPPPRFLDNLRNLPNFTDIRLYINGYSTYMQFNGPNGWVRMVPRTGRVGRTHLVLESLGQFDTSKVGRLRVDCYDSPSSDPPSRALLLMERLRTLTLRHCRSLHIFVHTLQLNMSSSEVAICPELEEFVIVPDEGTLNMKSLIEMAAARALRGAKLKTIKIVGRDQPARTDVLELERHVLDVESAGPEVDGAYDDSDGIGDED